MSDAPDPAAGRFAVLQVVRLTGAVMAAFGAAILLHKWPQLASIPDAAGAVLMAVGAIDFFIMPMLLARRWKSGP